jgi:hypothetical protein
MATFSFMKTPFRHFNRSSCNWSEANPLHPSSTNHWQVTLSERPLEACRSPREDGEFQCSMGQLKCASGLTT